MSICLSMILKNDSTFVKNWESTSDSVAAWLHSKINSLGLLYVKSLTFEKKPELSGLFL